MKKYWLIKSEPDCYSIHDLKRDKHADWTGIRNYQARNYIRDGMKPGDGVLFYHSGANPPAVVGVAQVASVPHGDPTAFEKKGEYFDPKSTKENPIWMSVDVKFVSEFKSPITLPQIKFDPVLRNMVVAQQGSRLSVQPVSELHFKKIEKLGQKSRKQ